MTLESKPKFKITYCRRDGYDFRTLSGDPEEKPWIIIDCEHHGCYATDGKVFYNVVEYYMYLDQKSPGWAMALNHYVPKHEVVALKQILSELL